MLYDTGMKDRKADEHWRRKMALEWGLAHRLLDALGIGKHGAALHVRIHQMLRQFVGGTVTQAPEPESDTFVKFDDEPTKPAKKPTRKK